MYTKKKIVLFLVTGSLFLGWNYPVVSKEKLQSDKDSFSGFSIGISGGFDFGYGKTTFSGFQNTVALKVSNSHDTSLRSPFAGIFLGYGKTMNRIYIGGEVTAESYKSVGKFSTSFEDGETNKLSIKEKKKSSLSASLKIGFPVDEKTLLYLKGGLVSNDYQVQSFLTSTVGSNLTVLSSKNKRLLQGIAGIGVERKITEIISYIDFHIGGEYEHIFEKSTKINLYTDSFKGMTKVKLSGDTIKVKLIFKF